MLTRSPRPRTWQDADATPVTLPILLMTILWVALITSGCAAEAVPSSTHGGVMDTAASDAPTDTTPDNSDSSVAEPAPPERPPSGEFTAIEPGGDTICARGGPYRFFVHGGDPDKVIIDFQGPWGGACWNVLTCQVGGEVLGHPIFTDSVTSLAALKATHEAGELGGIYDFDDPENPFYGWTVVHAPYCTGDLHWGDATVNYSDGLTIHHRGSVNAESVVAWTKAHYPNAEEVVSAGSGMGGYGAIAQAPNVALNYPEASVTILVDSAVGIISDDFFAAAFPKWNAVASLPIDLIRRDGVAFEDVNMVDLYVAIAASHPKLRIAQYTTATDQAQALYYFFMGGDSDLWPAETRDTLTQIRARTQNFRYYLAPGPIHGLHNYDILYEQSVNGVPYTSWLREVIGGDVLPDDVSCEAPCLEDPICAGCLDGSNESSQCMWCEAQQL